MLWAHMRRMHPHMSPMAQAELTNRLVQTPKLCRAMISIASHGEGDRSGFIEVVRSCIMLQRCLVQAIDFNDSPLLQLPHVRSVPKGAPGFHEVVRSPEKSLLKQLGSLTAEQVLDIQSFCQHVPLVELSYTVEVNDEAEMAEGDMSTLKVTLTRTNLSKAECAGPVHAPFFPAVKYEEWWLLVYDKRGRRMIAADLVLGTGRVCKSSVNFIVPRPGEFEWTVFAMCDSYAGGLRNGGTKPHDSEEEEEPSARQEQMLKRDAKKDVNAVEVVDGDSGETEENKKVESKEKKEAKKTEGSDEEDEEEKAVPDGSYFRITDTTGSFIYREPTEDRVIRCLHGALDQLDAKAGKVGCLIMSGAGSKAFCAGGDVQMIREEGLAGGSLPADFFYEEYGVMFRLATLLERTGCCQVSLCDGITMGGGVGLSTHGPFRIVTEKTRFAMPEMAIGLFPDVGATYLLSRLKAGGNVGRFMAMTGTTLAAWDALRAGVGTHFVPSSRIPKLRVALGSRFKAKLIGEDALRLCEDRRLIKRCTPTPPFCDTIREVAASAEPSGADCLLIDENIEVIERCFSAPSVEETQTMPTCLEIFRVTSTLRG
eukprot:g14841.t1